MANGLPLVEITQGDHTMPIPTNAERCLQELFAAAGFKNGDSNKHDGVIYVKMDLRARGTSRSPKYKMIGINSKLAVHFIATSDGGNDSRRRYSLYPVNGLSVKQFHERLDEAIKLLTEDYMETKKRQFARIVFKNKNLLNIAEAAVTNVFTSTGKQEVSKIDLEHAIDAIRLGPKQDRTLGIGGRYAVVFLRDKTKLIESCGFGKFRLLRKVSEYAHIHPVKPAQEEVQKTPIESEQPEDSERLRIVKYMATEFPTAEGLIQVRIDFEKSKLQKFQEKIKDLKAIEDEALLCSIYIDRLESYQLERPTMDSIK